MGSLESYFTCFSGFGDLFGGVVAGFAGYVSVEGYLKMVRELRGLGGLYIMGLIVFDYG